MSKERVTLDAQDLFQRGHQSFHSKDFREAIECFTRAVALRPDIAAGYRYRALAYLQLGQRTDALNDLDRAIRIKSDDPALLADRAEVLYKQKAYDAAIADCDKVLTLDPAWAPIRGLRAECYAAQGNTDKALEDFAAAIEGDTEQAPRYLLARAKLHLECDNLVACEEDCSIVLTLDPENAGAYRTRGMAARERGDLGGAESDLSESIRLEPEAALGYLARAMVRVDRADYAPAAQDCDQVIQIVPNNAQAFILRGISRKHLGDAVGAIADYTAAANLVPDVPNAYNLRASVHYEQGRYAKAIQDHMEALKRSPRDPSTFNHLGWLWSTVPDPDVRNGRQAKECATRACELSEWQEAGYLDTLAAACAECGDFDEAVKWQQRALQLAKAELTSEYESRLTLYREGKPYRSKAS